MTSATLSERRQGELWRRLGTVNDPELDEPVTEMGFVERAEILGDGRVEVDFRLPTYWCSPNFAFLMLEDLKIALEALSWSPAYRITLHDHMFAEEVNKGIADGRNFAEIFRSLADETSLEEVREKFRQKAFKRRQEAVILDLRATGLSDREIVGMRLTDLDALYAGDDETAKRGRRYREALLSRRPDLRSHDNAIVDWDSRTVEADGLAAHLADLRSVRINMEFNGALCRGLKQTRYKEMEIVNGEPTLVDFIVGRVPAPTAPSPTTDH
ncbi:iron-sulfur cluster assembly protein [Rhizobium multihospitium]|uniref:Metal-sulfur cluster biosynthetic enzyme n=1 Tax=Rhizobium multihospitium TaxID=410764 RepID=A0A1C3VW08_9HYPH|nr:iron-sulfur cluster assembly protein [Rhizobium multihospitium]SCB31909.1 Metal-sulfur cluster biosynthetic enzyme [Rhizobium multihospitium]